MILQTDKRLPEPIPTFGCYLCSCLYHAEKKTGKTFTADDVVGIYRAAKQTGIIGDECFVKDPVALMTLAGAKGKSVTKATNNVYPVPPAVELLHFHRDADTPKGMGNSVHDHFVAGTGTGKVAFDPLGDSNTVKYGFLQNKRIIEVS